MAAELGRMTALISADVSRFNTGMQNVQKSLGKTQKSIASVGNIIKGALVAAPVLALGKSVFTTTSEFEKLNKVLETSLGSSGSAALAFSTIQDFASSTPFQVKEITESFVKLANRGIIPTKEELTKLGDLAASQGKSFDQLTEAILDATTGEFERLKEFGIRAKQQGDQVAFTFKGVETTVKKTDDAIQDYILSLGELEGVSGGMANISETLAGKTSNLGDAIDNLFFRMGKLTSGPMKFFLDLATDIVGVLTNEFTGGVRTIEDYSDQIRSMISDFNQLGETGKRFELNTVEEAMQRTRQEIAETQRFIKDLDNRSSEAFKSITESGGGMSAWEDAMKEANQKIVDLNLDLEVQNTLFTEYNRVVSEASKKVEEKAKAVGELRKQYEAVRAEIEESMNIEPATIGEIAELQAQALGELQAKQKESADFIANILAEGPTAETGFLEANNEMVDNIKSKWGELSEGARQVSQVVQQSFVSMFEGVGESIGNIIANTGGFYQLFDNIMAAVIDFAKQFGQVLISIGVAKLALENIGISGIGAIIAGTALVALATAAKGMLSRGPEIPALAEGGIAYGPTLAMVGDNPGARTDPEVIAPLSKLEGMGSGNGQPSSIQITGLSGQVLKAILHYEDKILRYN